MSQIHKRLTDEQIHAFFQSYCQGTLSRTEIQKVLEIGKTRFFARIKVFREVPQNFTIAYHRRTPAKLSTQAEGKIKKALLKEKKIVEDPDLPISGYNFSAIHDRLKKEGVQVSVPTIINRAKQLNCHKPRKKGKSHDREVLTKSIGALIQHDASPWLKRSGI